MTGASVQFNHPPAPLYNVQGGAPFDSVLAETAAPPSYEDAINPNGKGKLLANLITCH